MLQITVLHCILFDTVLIGFFACFIYLNESPSDKVCCWRFSVVEQKLFSIICKINSDGQIFDFAIIKPFKAFLIHL